MIRLLLPLVLLVIPVVSGVDTHIFCCYWASINQCFSNPVYMRSKCQTSCGTIGCSKSNVTACKNVKLNIENCHLIPDSRFQHKQSLVKTGQVKDSHPFCCYWAGIGQCSRNAMFMKLNCQKSCGTAGCTAETIQTCHVKIDIGNCPFDLTQSKHWSLDQLLAMSNNEKKKEPENKEFVLQNTITAIQPFNRKGILFSAERPISQFSSPSNASPSQRVTQNIRSRVDNILRKLQSLEQRLFPPKRPSTSAVIKNEAKIKSTFLEFVTSTSTKSPEPRRPFLAEKVPNRSLTEDEQDLFIKCKKLYSSVFVDFSQAAKNFGAINFLSIPIDTFLTSKQIDLHLACKTLYYDIFQ
jgi:hypothetical protein